MKKPSWWNKPITWGTSVTMSLLSLPISLLIILIMDAVNYGTDGFYTGPIIEKTMDAKEWISSIFKK